MSTAIFGLTVILFTFGGLPISSLPLTMLVSLCCQAAMIAAVTAVLSNRTGRQKKLDDTNHSEFDVKVK